MATERHFNKIIQLSKWFLCLSEALQKSWFQWKHQFFGYSHPQDTASLSSRNRSYDALNLSSHNSYIIDLWILSFYILFYVAIYSQNSKINYIRLTVFPKDTLKAALKTDLFECIDTLIPIKSSLKKNILESVSEYSFKGLTKKNII
jgi:hypothetical protein